MLDRFSRSDRLAGGGALLALIATLLPWYHFDVGGSRVTTNGLGSGFCGDVLFLAAAGMVFVLMVRQGFIAIRSDLTDRRIDTTLGIAALGAVVLQVLIGVNGSGAFHFATLGLGVALVAGALMAMGAWSRGHEMASHRPAVRRR
jgi:hypothetical protein